MRGEMEERDGDRAAGAGAGAGPERVEGSSGGAAVRGVFLPKRSPGPLLPPGEGTVSEVTVDAHRLAGREHSPLSHVCCILHVPR